MPDPLKTNRQKQSTMKDHAGLQRIGLGNGKHQGMDSLPKCGHRGIFTTLDPLRKIKFFHHKSTLRDKHHRSE